MTYLPRRPSHGGLEMPLFQYSSKKLPVGHLIEGSKEKDLVYRVKSCSDGLVKTPSSHLAYRLQLERADPDETAVFRVMES